MIIDVHCHAWKKKTYEEYLKKSKGKISKSIILHYFREENFNKLLSFVESKDNLFLVASIDVDKDISKQVKYFESFFKKKKIFGIKLYPGYQYFYPSEKKIFPIAKLCQKYGKPLIFHSGDVWDPENKSLLKYSHPKYIGELAVNFPKCKIVISHFGFPHFLETANILSKNKNVFTDISGTLDDCSKAEMKNLIKQYSQDLKRILTYFPDIKDKIMFGTDYSGEETPLNQVLPYIELVKKSFTKKTQENVFYKTAKKVYLN